MRYLLCLCAALSVGWAGYVLKWALPVYLNPFDKALSPYNDDYAGSMPEGQWDVTGDGARDCIGIGVPGDDTAIVLLDGITHQPTWVLPYPPDFSPGVVHLSSIVAWDGSKDTFLIVCFGGSSPEHSPVRPGVMVYRCSDHSLTFSVPQPASGSLVEAGPCPDLDGDGLPEIALYVCDGDDTTPDAGTCEFYGWSKTSGAPPKPPKLPEGFPVGR